MAPNLDASGRQRNYMADVTAKFSNKAVPSDRYNVVVLCRSRRFLSAVDMCPSLKAALEPTSCGPADNLVILKRHQRQLDPTN